MTIPSPHSRPPYDFNQGTVLPFLLKNKLFHRIVLWQALIITALTILAIVLCLPLFAEFPEFLKALEGADLEEDMEGFKILLAYIGKFMAILFLTSIPMFLVSSSAMAAMFRQYLSNETVEGFPLKFDSDMWRICFTRFIVGLLMLGTFIITVATFGVFLPLYIYVAVRLTPVVAMSFHNKRITIGEGWNASKGYFWWMVLSFIVISIMAYIAQQIIMYGDMAVLFAGNMDMLSTLESASEEEALSLLKQFITSPAVLIGGMIAVIFLSILQSVGKLCNAGIGAHVTRLKVNALNISDVFAD